MKTVREPLSPRKVWHTGRFRLQRVAQLEHEDVVALHALLVEPPMFRVRQNLVGLVEEVRVD